MEKYACPHQGFHDLIGRETWEMQGYKDALWVWMSVTTKSMLFFFLIEMEDKGGNLDFGRKIVGMYYVEMELP